MKKTWKRWLGTVAAALVTSTALAQSPNGAGVATTRGQSPQYSEEGLIRMGHPSASATGRGVRQTQYEPAINPEAVFEDYRSGGGYAPQGQGGAPPQVGGDYPTQNDGGYYNERQVPGFAPLRSINDVQWRVGHQGLDTLGYKGETTNLNAFVPLMSDDSQNLLFFVPRVNFFSSGNANTGDVGGNLGLGLRHFDPANHRIYGISGWWDYDPGHQRIYNQAGLSLESLGKYSSLRFNANVPLEKSTDITSAASLGSPFFQGNNIAYFYNFQRESSYQNYQLEIASPIPLLGRYGAEWAVSGYGLVANAKGAPNSAGIAGRLELQVSEDFWINATVSNDKIYGTNTGINFELTLPNGPQTRWLRLNRSRDKMLSSVKRTYRVSTAINAVQETQFFLNSKNGAAIQVAHIDPEAASVGTGAVLNPFGSVADYMANAGRAGFDIIYVGRNADGSDTDLNTGIEVLGCQRLLGTGTLADGSVHQFVTLDRGDGGTLFNLPGFGNSNLQSTGANPFMTNSAAPVGTPVVSINGNITEVTGFQFDASGTANVIQSAIPVDGFAITNNTFQNAIDAINIVSDTSPVLGITTTLPPSRSPGENYGIVTNNTIDGALGTPGGMVNGIVIDHVGGTGAEALHLRVTDNTLSTLTGTGIDVTAEAGTQIVANATSFGFQDNTITSAGQGILARSTGAGTIFDLTVQNNTITNSTDVVDPLNPELGAGMGFLADNGGAFNFNLVTNNRVTNVLGGGGRGGAFVAESGGTMTFTPDVVGDPVFFANTFTGNGDDGLLFEATGAGSAITLQEVLNNTFTNNGASGLDFMALAGGSVSSGPITGNTMTGNTEDGLSGTADGAGSVLDLQIGSADPLLGLNVITGNQENGIDLLSSNGATLTAPIVRNTITGNTLDGIHYALDTTTHDIIDIQQNTITDNGDGGIDIVADTATINDIFIDANTIDRNLAGDGVRFLAIDSSVANQLVISNNSVSSNALNGINIEIDNTSINDLVIIDNNQGTAFAAGTLNVDYFNAIFTTSIDNNSSPGLNVASVVIDISPVGQIWRPEITPFINQFNVTGLSDVTVGLTAIDGVAVPAGTVPFPLPNGGVPLNTSTIDFDFNDFNPGETFDYRLSHSLPGGPMELGTTLVGSTMTVTLEDGRSASAVFTAGSFNVTQAFAQSFAGISANGLDGIRIAPSNGSSITSMTIDNNTIDANGTNGIEIIPVNSTLPTLGNPGVISNNTITNNVAGDGVRLVNPGTNGTPIALDFTNNTISGHAAGLGINVQIDDQASSFVSTLTQNTITNNALGGTRFAASQAATLFLTIGGADPTLGNTYTGNGDFNLSIDLVDSASLPGLTLIQNNSFTDAVDGPNPDFLGEGIVLRATDNTAMRNVQILDNTITGNANDGIQGVFNGNAQIHSAGNPLTGGLLIQRNIIGTAADPNGGDGIHLLRDGNAIVRAIIGDAVDITQRNSIIGNTQHGLNIETRGGDAAGAIGTFVSVGNNLFDGNGIDNIHIETFDSSTTQVDLTLNDIFRAVDDGVEVRTNNSSYFGASPAPTGAAQFDGNIIDSNGGNGIELVQANTAPSTSILNVDITGTARTTRITNNGTEAVPADGVNIQQLGTGSMDVTIGTAGSSSVPVGSDTNPDRPEVFISANRQDAINVIQTGAGNLLVDVNNTFAEGRRVAGGASRNGFSYNEINTTQVQAGATATILVDNSTFTNFGADGMHFYFNDTAPDVGGTHADLNVLVTDSVIGQSQFNFNAGDGVDIEVRDGGGTNNATFDFQRNQIYNNSGDGLRMIVQAETFVGASAIVRPEPLGGGDNDNSFPNPGFGPNGPYTQINTPTLLDNNFIDVTSHLNMVGNDVRFNGLNGVNLRVGAAAQLGTAADPVVIRDNQLFANTLTDFTTSTFTNTAGATAQGGTDTATDGQFDIFFRDPVAHLNLAFGDNDQPNSGNALNPTNDGGTFVAGDVYKGAGRNIHTDFNVVVPDENTPGSPLPNDFNLFGFPIDEAQIFRNNYNDFFDTVITP